MRIPIINFLIFIFIAFSNSQTLKIYPDNHQIPLHYSGNIQIKIDSVANLFAVAIDFNYLPQLIQINQITEGSFLNQGGTVPTSMIYQIDSLSGVITLGLTRLNSSLPGVNCLSDTTLLTISFTSIDYGICPLRLSNVSLIEPDGITQIPCNIKNDTLTIINPNGMGEMEKSNDYQFQLPFPNPFNSIIYFPIQNKTISEEIILKIYSILGEHIKTLRYKTYFNENIKLSWDGRDDTGNSVPSGIYICQIRKGQIFEVFKIQFIK